MKIYGESIPLQASKAREALNIHSRVKAALDKSGLRDGVCVIYSPDSDSAVVIMPDDSRLFDELERRFEQLGADSDHLIDREGSASSARFQGLMLGRQVTLPFSEGRFEIGPGDAVFFLELNGIRPRRVNVKILGE